MRITRHMAHCQALTIHNRTNAAGKLPMELLSEIFHVGLDEYSPHDFRMTKYLGAIISTCCAWRDAAMGTPSLWRHIIYEDNHDHPNQEGHSIFRHTGERLRAYLSRSKNCIILLYLKFGAGVPKFQDIKEIVYPRLSRCLTIRLSFADRSTMRNFLPLPGNLPRLTAFDCVTRYHRYFYREFEMYTLRLYSPDLKGYFCGGSCYLPRASLSIA